MIKRRLIKSKFYKYTPEHALRDMEKVIEKMPYYTPPKIIDFMIEMVNKKR